jgi:hypothetical protein
VDIIDGNHSHLNNNNVNGADLPQPLTYHLSRRQLLLGMMASVGVATLALLPRVVGAKPATLYEGADLSAWSMLLGDGIYAAPGEAPVTMTDIETIHASTHSELRANLQGRSIMAHNLMIKKITDAAALEHIHFCTYEFRLPFLPTQGNSELNAQTLEGGVVLWEGAVARLKHNVGFQWGLNPSQGFGVLRVWTSADNGSWQEIGLLPVDQAWHRVQLMLDYPYRIGSLRIDDVSYQAALAITPGPTTWGSDISVTMSAEIISIYPGSGVAGALHIAEFRNWRWEWIPSAQAHTFFPLIGQE